ncbi:hypothetical protein QCA50_015641 [Cerrena zonata]|uniref:Uncharacterized protein n=1 Tax=Cerrena zonata TaxID=2478898 RepID=A0AAW0FNX1_9APHY
MTNIHDVVDYLTNAKFAPVGGLLRSLDNIISAHLKTSESASLPFMEIKENKESDKEDYIGYKTWGLNSFQGPQIDTDYFELHNLESQGRETLMSNIDDFVIGSEDEDADEDDENTRKKKPVNLSPYKVNSTKSNAHNDTNLNENSNNTNDDNSNAESNESDPETLFDASNAEATYS